MDWLTAKQWSPYAVGAGIGVLSWLAFLLSDHPIGCSTAFARVAGMVEKSLRGKKAEDRPYFRKFAPEITWEVMLVLGVVIGAFASVKLSSEFGFTWVPARWQAAFGDSAFVRWLGALAGGTIMGFGARWAGGCTSGHGISGTLQLSVSSWVAVTCFFVGGILTAMIIFKVIAA
jgi:uncharacterized membrane protein YedE/YeeE